MQSTPQITPQDITEQVRHWLGTPPDGYLGSSYGADTKALLQRPQSDAQALQQFIEKMYRDLPVLTVLPVGAVRVWTQSQGADTLALNLSIAGQLITVGGAK